MSRLVKSLTKHRRFRILFALLLLFSVCLGLIVVPIESRAPNANINNLFDGLWWSTTTITSVGYGDTYPVTNLGRVIGMALEVIGVLAFGLLIGIISVTLAETKERFYWKRMYRRIDELEAKIDQLSKKDSFVVKSELQAKSDNDTTS